MRDDPSPREQSSPLLPPFSRAAATSPQTAAWSGAEPGGAEPAPALAAPYTGGRGSGAPASYAAPAAPAAAGGDQAPRAATAAPEPRTTATEDAAWPDLREQAGAAAASRDTEAPARPADYGAGFPLDAFIIPEDAERLPNGYESGSSAESLARSLEELAGRIRTQGIGALGPAPDPGELARLLALIVAAGASRRS